MVSAVNIDLGCLKEGIADAVKAGVEQALALSREAKHSETITIDLGGLKAEIAETVKAGVEEALAQSREAERSESANEPREAVRGDKEGVVGASRLHAMRKEILGKTPCMI